VTAAFGCGPADARLTSDGLPDELLMNILDLSLDHLRIAIRNNLVSFPSQVPIFSAEPRSGVQWRLAELYFIHNWSSANLAPRYGLSGAYVSKLISRWVRRATVLGYLQEAPGMEAAIDLRVRGRAAPCANGIRATSVQQIFLGRTSVDLKKRIFRTAGFNIYLTASEWAVLDALASEVNRMVPRYELAKLLSTPGTKRGLAYLRGVIRDLRQKLEPDPVCPQYLVTERRVGYRLQLTRSP
jgi:hypothetical protein